MVLYCTLRVFMAGSLFSICTLICHSAKSVKKDSHKKDISYRCHKKQSTNHFILL